MSTQRAEKGSRRGGRGLEGDAWADLSTAPLTSQGAEGRLGALKETLMPSNLDEQFQTLHEIARAARRNLADGPWDYMVGGTETETTLRRNRAAIDAIAFRPRVLRDTSKVDSTSTFMGRPVRLPVMLAPVGSVE